MDLRERQRPLKQRYREESDAARITITARGSEREGPDTCSIDIGRAVQQAEAHPGVGGPGIGACSGALGIGDAPVGFEEIRMRLEVDAPGSDPEQLAALHEKTERYCVVLHTLSHGVRLRSELVAV